MLKSFLFNSDQSAAQKFVSIARPYFLVILSVVFSTLVRFSLNPFFGRRVAFITYFPALVFSAWVGSWGGGLVALALSTLAATYYFISPTHAIFIAERNDQISLLVFIIVGLSVSAISSSQRQARQQAIQSAEDAKRTEEEARRSEQALRESEALKAAVLDSTGEGIYGIDTQGRFTFVNRAAAQMLGYTPEAMIGRSGHALIHHTRPSGALYPENECPIYHAIRGGEAARIEEDVFWRADGTSFPVAYDAAPIVQAETVQGAVVTFADISERKAIEQERARIATREHRIAEQLQAALQPRIPASAPGLELADYYRPALAEAGVGGDFSDVYASDKQVTFLVVGDLSGKGLAAASQVAIVRNMLRFALYNGRTLAGPITSLNRTLAENELLTGFATLFVGRYEAQTRLLTYVNCGQDAGLVLRAASGQVEALPPTGPVLGAIERAVYSEETVTLEPGDMLALYTDGLTEAGPSRTALLTGDGVAAILREHAGQGNAQERVSQLMAGVDTYAQSGVRDDQCLLIGVVK